jgi:hypothetical protein
MIYYCASCKAISQLYLAQVMRVVFDDSIYSKIRKNYMIYRLRVDLLVEDVENPTGASYFLLLLTSFPHHFNG